MAEGSGDGHREGPCRSQPRDWAFPTAMAVAPGCLYLVLTLVPEGLRRQVIDGQGPIQVANGCQRHPEQRAPQRLTEEPGPMRRPLLPGASAPLPSSSRLSAGQGPAHTHTLQKPKDSTELDSLSSPSPTLGWEAMVSGLKTPTTYEPEERIRGRPL